MRAKDKDFRNMVDDPYLYCCGGTSLNAVEPGEDVADPAPAVPDVPLKVRVRPIFDAFAVIGVIASASWLYKKLKK